MNFNITDHRPWYKQLITGLGKGFTIAFYTLSVLIVLIALMSAIYYSGIFIFIKWTAIYIIGLLTFIAAAVALEKIYNWAKK